MREVLIIHAIIIIFWLYFYASRKVKMRLKYLMPLLNLAFWLLALLSQITSYGQSEPSLSEQVAHYFHNDVSMVFGLLIIPCILTGTLIPLVGIVVYAIVKRTYPGTK
jgi:hypothetical protein